MKTGFTLAEVLITLGIIGVVAALTMPTLIANYQKKVWVTQLKKSVSMFEQGFQAMKASDGVDDLLDTSVWESIPGDYCSLNNTESTNQECIPFFNSFLKYFPGSQLVYLQNNAHRVKALTGNSYLQYSQAVILFPSGAMLYHASFNTRSSYKTDPDEVESIKKQGGNMFCRTSDAFYIDVNGFKKPNTGGRDVFSFTLSCDGKLYPSSGKDEAAWMNDFYDDISKNKDYWRNNSSICGTPGKPINTKSQSSGYGCVARIIENGWEMDY